MQNYYNTQEIFNHNQKQAMSGAKKSVLRECINAGNQRCKLLDFLFSLLLMYDVFYFFCSC